MTKTMDELCVNTIRTLAMDAVQRGNSGHPGTPMALAPVVYCLWQRFLRFDPNHPIWPNRDRFVLSAGHASTLLHAMLHLVAVRTVNPKYETLGQLSVTLEDIERFRQLESIANSSPPPAARSARPRAPSPGHTRPTQTPVAPGARCHN